MKAWLIDQPGDLDNLYWGDIEDITAKQGEIIVKVKKGKLLCKFNNRQKQSL